jgi:very-short-patch-repair endonuclease
MKLCECGCGKEVTNKKNRFINGHAWVGKHHSKESRLQISDSNKKPKTDEFKRKMSNIIKSESTQKKFNQTCLNRYGYKNPFQSKEVQEKIKQTNLKSLGVENPAQSEIIKERMKQTNLKNLGVEYHHQSEIIKEKKKQTYLKHYGADNWAKTSEGRLVHSINAIKRIENQQNNNEPIMPCIGYYERSFLNELQIYTTHNIIRQESSFRYVVGQFPDGHIPELKLFIQFDERVHFLDLECKIYKETDINKTLQLASLGYIIFRVSEHDWKTNKEQVINSFKSLTNELQKGL